MECSDSKRSTMSIPSNSLDPERLAILEREMDNRLDPAAWHYETIRALIRLHEAVRIHHAKIADYRCLMDDDLLYEAARLPPVDGRAVHEDTARLDWLDGGNPGGGAYVDSDKRGRWIRRDSSIQATVREAIDEARREQGGGR